MLVRERCLVTVLERRKSVRQRFFGGIQYVTEKDTQIWYCDTLLSRAISPTFVLGSKTLVVRVTRLDSFLGITLPSHCPERHPERPSKSRGVSKTDFTGSDPLPVISGAAELGHWPPRKLAYLIEPHIFNAVTALH